MIRQMGFLGFASNVWEKGDRGQKKYAAVAAAAYLQPPGALPYWSPRAFGTLMRPWP